MAYSKDELEALTGPQLVEIYNKLNKKYPIIKFDSKSKGVDRILQFQRATDAEGPSLPESKPTKQKEPKVPREPKQPKAPKEKKPKFHDVMTRMFLRPEGASCDETVEEAFKVFPDRNKDSMATTFQVQKNPNGWPLHILSKSKIEGRGLVFKLTAK